MNKIRQFITTELKGWKKTEILWMAAATAVMLGLSLYWKDNLIGILSGLTGVWCVILTGKGKISAFIIGTINVFLYAYIAYGAKYYGDVMLNLLYYFPTDFIGIFMWKKHIQEDSAEVSKKRMTAKQSAVVYPLTAAGVVIYGLILKKMGGNLPFIDSTSTVLSVVAQIMTLKRFAEQWILYIVIDVVTVIMWIFAFFNGGESVATLIMWILYLLNAVFMLIKWERDVKNEI